MNSLDARADIERMTAWNADPALSTADVDRLLVLARRTDAAGNAPDTYAEWTPSATRIVGDKRVPAVRNGYVYRVTVAGTSGAAEPIWPTTIAATVVDGGATWACDAVAPWAGVWNVNAAAAQGLRWKAAKVAAEFDVALGSGKKFGRSQKYKQLMEMARKLDGGGIGSIRVVGIGHANPV